MYDLFIDQPAPLVPRHLRLEVKERITADGGVLTALDESTVTKAITRLKEAGVEGVAICLLHAYRNPVHERALAAFCAELLPGVSVSCSSEVVPEIREYERTSDHLRQRLRHAAHVEHLDDLERKPRSCHPGRFTSCCRRAVHSNGEARADTPRGIGPGGGAWPRAGA
jgi:N-methylhydantoinase A